MKNTLKKQMDSRDMERMSLIYAMFVAVGYVNYMIGSLFDVGGMYFSLVILGIMMVICYKTMVKIKFSGLTMTFILLVSLYYASTRQVVGTTIASGQFMFYFVVASVLAMYKCNTEKFLRYTACVSMLIIPFYNEIFVEMSSTRYSTNISMGLSYSMFPLLLASMVHFLFYRKESGAIMKIVYVISTVFLIDLALKGTRGILVALVFFAALCFIRSIDKKKAGVSGLRVTVVAIVVILCIVYFYEILSWLRNLLNSLGIDAYFIEKIFRLQKAGDVTNGREYIFKYTLEHILNSPIIGHGIGSIFYNSNWRISYAHNFILQLFYDGGFVLSVPVLLVLGYGFIRTCKMTDKDEATLMIFLLSISIPRATFSGDIWENGFFWLLVLHIMKFHVGASKIKDVVDETTDDTEVVGNIETAESIDASTRSMMKSNLGEN